MSAVIDPPTPTVAGAATAAGPAASSILALQQRLLASPQVSELAFALANETWHLVRYTQACVFVRDVLGRWRLQSVSGLVDAVQPTPFTLWAQDLAPALARSVNEGRALRASDVPPPLQAGWAEWWPAEAWAAPLIGPGGSAAPLGLLVLLRDEPFTRAEGQAVTALARAAGTTLAALAGSAGRLSRWRAWAQRRRVTAVAAALGVLACLPVPMSVLAPAEVVALRSEAVTAPADGVVKDFHVQPNAAVKQGDLLFTLDDTTLRSRRQVAEQSLSVARADVLAAQQRAFDQVQSRGELAALQGRVQEREAELAWIDASLQRLEVRAAHDGVLVYADANDWLGRPVTTGERIAQLAEPQALGVMVWVPVGDAITLDAGSAIRLYLQTAPLNALQGTLTQTSYQASLSPEGVASYRVRGELSAGTQAHIGLRGVAKIQGGWQPLAYAALRRPLGALRQWTGL